MAAALLVAFLAGFSSFVSPCVLPLIPGYLSFISGVSIEDLGENRSKVLASSGLFVLGFAVIFVAMGASASVIGVFLNAYRPVIERISGVVIILFGLAVLGVIDLPLITGGGVKAGRKRFGLVGAVPLGMSFGIAWTPCVTYNLAPILLLASQATTVGRGALLLAFYAAGLGIPFILTGVFFSRAKGVLAWLARHRTAVTSVAGGLLIGMGLLLLSGKLSQVFLSLQKIIPQLEVKL
ncbi:MAG: cytochrome c biogenesis CcdA family protein [Candidatus Aquicultorales bacterium]